MRKHSVLENNEDFKRGSHNWLLHARYVRGEHALCMELAENLQKETNNAHRYAHFIKGAVLAEAGRLQEAVDKFHTCSRLLPQDPEPLKQVAKCLYRQGRFQLALEAYLEADKLSKHPDPDIYCALAECAWSIGDAERGVECARAAERAGGGERAGALLARLLQAVGDTSGALAAYDINDLPMHLAECAWSIGDAERGVECARAAERAGGGERAGALLARLLQAVGDTSGALAAYDINDLPMHLAECAWSIGDAERGVECARAAERAGGGERAGALLARLLQAVGDTSGALAAYDINDLPMHLAECAWSIGDAERGVECARAAERAGGGERAGALLARLLQAVGDTSGALAAYDINDLPMHLAECAWSIGDAERGVECARAAERAGGGERAGALLARLLQAVGDTSGALAAYDINDLPMHLAECAWSIGDAERGVECARAAERAGGGERAGALLARLLQAVGDTSGALAAYDINDLPMHLAECAWSIGDAERGVECARAAERAGGGERAGALLARLLQAVGDTSGALAAYDINDLPMHLAECAWSIGDAERGVECARAAERAGGGERAGALLARLLQAVGDTSGALAAYDINDLPMHLAECAWSIGDAERGVECARAAERAGGGERAGALLARLLQAVGDTSGALAAYDINDLPMHLAECAWSIGDAERGVECARAAERAGGGERAGALLARLLQAVGDTSGALAAYDINDLPMHLAECAWSIGDAERGVECARAAERAGGGERAGALLARLLQAVGDTSGALAAYDINDLPMHLAECAWSIGDAERGVECARAAERAGGGERAGALLARLLQAVGDTSGALAAYDINDLPMHLAECAWSIGDAERGVECARAAERAGGGERAGALLARLLQAVGDTSGALAAYDHALASHTCGADTLAAAGALCLRVGEPRRAFQLLSDALSQQPTQHAAALALAAMLLQHRDVDAGLARLKAALSAHPTCVAAHSNLGLALLTKKKFVAALTCLQRAVWAAPLSARAAHNLGYALLMCKRPASAFCRLACSAALQPTQHYTVLLIAIALEHLGDGRADAAYTRAASLAPHDALVRLNLAGRHARAGRLVDAVEEARVVAELLQGAPDPQLASSLATLMGLLREAGVNLSELPSTSSTDEHTANPNEENTQEKTEFEPDEV